MDYNVLNGGLLLKCGERWIMGDPDEGFTKYRDTNVGMYWFMNHVEDAIYCSDQEKDNALCRFDLQTNETQVVIDKPCDEVYVHEDSLYYIDEHDRKLYRSSLNGRHSEVVVGEAIVRYAIHEGQALYTTERAIKSCNLSGARSETVCETTASAFVLVGGSIAYTDPSQHGVVQILNIHSGATVSLQDVACSMLHTDGTYVYCANHLHERSIYRIDPHTAKYIRISGDSARYIHLIQDELCYFANGSWYVMPLSGGQPEILNE